MAKKRPLDIATELLEAFEHNGRVNEYLVGVLPEAIWRQKFSNQRLQTIVNSQERRRRAM